MFNGSGTFLRLYSWQNDAASGIRIRADRMDNEDNGFAQGLSTCITRDGQSTITANLPMSGYKFTNVADASLRNEYASYGQLQDGVVNWAVAGGTADAVTAAYNPPVTTLKDGQLFFVRASGANTIVAPTFNPDGLGAVAITKNGGTALVAGDIPAAGAEVVLRYRASPARYELMNPANPLQTNTLAFFQHGQCRLDKAGSNIALTPLNGNKLVIDTNVQTIPAAGVTLAPTGLTPNTTYYIYAYMVSTTMTLEASVTGPATNAATGVVIKTGDATRTLVGMARAVTGPAFADTENQRFVISYFNRKSILTRVSATSSFTLASASPVEINAGMRNEFLTWGNSYVEHSITTTAINSAGNTTISVGIGYDGVSLQTGVISGAQTNANTPMAFNTLIRRLNLSEGYHYSTFIAFHTAATTTFQYSSSNDFTTVLSGFIQG